MKRRRRRRKWLSEFDDFAASLFEESKRFLEKATDANEDEGARAAYLHAALNLAFCSIEAHLNAVCEELASHKEFSAPHDLGVLREKDVRLEDGEFKLKGLRIYPLEERLTFVHRRVSGKTPDKQSRWWSDLVAAVALRNRLTHPKENPPSVNIQNVKSALSAIIEAIDVLYQAVYSRPFPPAKRGLQSKLTF